MSPDSLRCERGVGDIPVLSGHLHGIFGPARAKKVDGMVDIGGGELGRPPPSSPWSICKVLRPDPADSSDTTVCLAGNVPERVTSREEGNDLGPGI